MKRIRLIGEYDGTDYVGWQIQPNGVSVQEMIKAALCDLTGEDIVLHGSGRTDSGVHARAQVMHFDTSSRIPAEKFPYALNVKLPADIRILYGDEPGDGFHARYDVRRKHYRYTVYNAPHASVFCRNTALHVHHELDVNAMQRAAAAVCGEHDFSAFKAQGTDLKSTVRTIYRSEWTQDGKFLYYDICGSGFMYNMVRILVGTMIEIGKGYVHESIVSEALQSGKRDDAGATAPAHGLCMMRVEYDDFDTQTALMPKK